METKKAILSKTVWVNALVAIAGILSSFGLVPSVGEWIQANSGMILTALGVVGIVLRAVTKDKIVLID